ncbi:MAG: histone deacetylase family protein [Neomegalonema sp.]|nr:histone deacetylase family protein [Neomegalonema sp.]
MTTALITHSSCLEHITPEGHPEQVARLKSVLSALETPEFQDLVRIEAPVVTREQLERAHDPAYLDSIEHAAPREGLAAIDADTFMSPGTLEAARRAAGAVIAGVDAVMYGEVGNAFCAIRPPGHHAERKRAMGFCFYSNAVVGALHAVEFHKLPRVAIVDFDVHHGNGTQDIIEADARVFFGSSHEWPLYPGTGAPEEIGAGNIVNLCLPAHAGSADFRKGFAERILPKLQAFRPELLIISAGFDAHRADPLAQLELEADDFAWATDQLCAIAASQFAGRVVSTLEGGYDLRALAQSAAAHVRSLTMHGVAAHASR